MKKNIGMALVLGGLAGLAIVLGLKVYHKSTDSVVVESRSGNQSADVAVAEGDERTLAEKEALQTPPKGASEAAKKAHFEKVIPLAVESDTLDVGKCIGKPVVLKVKAGAAFTVRNNDERDHTIQMSDKLQFIIPAHGTKMITPEFDYGPGVYGYGCDNSQSAAGIFFVI